MIGIELYNLVYLCHVRETSFIVGCILYQYFICTCSIFKFRIIMIVVIFDQVYSEDGLWIYRWISSLVPTSIFLILCFPKVLLNAKGMVSCPGSQSALYWQMNYGWMRQGESVTMLAQTYVISTNESWMVCCLVMTVLLFKLLSCCLKKISHHSRCFL